MLKYFFKRVLMLLPKLLIITMIVFLALELVPGDPVTRTISPETYAKLSVEQLDDLREKLGLNDNLPQRYGRWLVNILQGDFGYSLVTGGQIRNIIAQRLPATFELALFALIIATILGLALGFLSAIKQNGIMDYLCTLFGMIGISVPEFFFGLCAIIIFAINLAWLPTGGRSEIGGSGLLSRIPYLIMPAVCLGISLIATLMRFTRGSMLDVLGKDYIKTARSWGLSETKVTLRYGFRNALIPIMVILVMRIPMLVGGTVVIENVFNYPGMGSMLLTAISGTDMPLVMIGSMIIAFFVLLSSFLVDLFTAFLDPRIRFYEGKGATK